MTDHEDMMARLENAEMMLRSLGKHRTADAINRAQLVIRHSEHDKGAACEARVESSARSDQPSMPSISAPQGAQPAFPPDVTKTEWARYAQNVYLAARTSSYGAGVPSHVLEAMRDVLLSAAGPKS